MRPEESEYTLALMAALILLRVSYELSRPKPKVDMHRIMYEPKSIPVIPQQKEWSERAIKNYAEAQEKKWRRWKEAMFE